MYIVQVQLSYLLDREDGWDSVQVSLYVMYIMVKPSHSILVYAHMPQGESWLQTKPYTHFVHITIANIKSTGILKKFTL